MYNSNSHPDRFAGQYPPPPPLQSPVYEQPVYEQHNTSFSTPLQNNPSFSAPLQTYTPPQQETYIPPPAPVLNDTDYYTHQPQYSQQPQYNDYYDSSHSNLHQDYSSNNNLAHSNNHLGQTETAQTSLDAYLRQEREEYLKNEPIKDTVPLTQQQQADPEKAPMLYQPYVTKPTLAPQQNEAEGYKYQPYEPRQKSCSCCCYNPAITCCSFFMLLCSIAFCAAGIALIIASKVISGKCDSSCSGISDKVAGACDTFCNTVLQNGLFYGGIVVAGLAGIAIIWKLVMWTCAGYSQRH